ncbi:hprA, partial [Symbiodinium sp. CCMP2456]
LCRPGAPCQTRGTCTWRFHQSRARRIRRPRGSFRDSSTRSPAVPASPPKRRSPSMRSSHPRPP